jgi:hypothetical protein
MGVGSVVCPVPGARHRYSAIGSDLAGGVWETRQAVESATMVTRPSAVWR